MEVDNGEKDRSEIAGGSLDLGDGPHQQLFGMRVDDARGDFRNGSQSIDNTVISEQHNLGSIASLERVTLPSSGPCFDGSGSTVLAFEKSASFACDIRASDITQPEVNFLSTANESSPPCKPKQINQQQQGRNPPLTRSNATVGEDDNRGVLQSGGCSSKGSARIESFQKRSSTGSHSRENYTDSTGADLIKFITQTLHKSRKDREFLLKTEAFLRSFVADASQHVHIFASMTSYDRMLIHRIAAYFGLDHNVDQTGSTVVVNKSELTRLPDVEFKSLIRHSNFDESSRYRRSVQSLDETHLANFISPICDPNVYGTGMAVVPASAGVQGFPTTGFLFDLNGSSSGQQLHEQEQQQLFTSGGPGEAGVVRRAYSFEVPPQFSPGAVELMTVPTTPMSPIFVQSTPHQPHQQQPDHPLSQYFVGIDPTRTALGQQSSSDGCPSSTQPNNSQPLHPPLHHHQQQASSFFTWPYRPQVAPQPASIMVPASQQQQQQQPQSGAHPLHWMMADISNNNNNNSSSNPLSPCAVTGLSPSIQALPASQQQQQQQQQLFFPPIGGISSSPPGVPSPPTPAMGVLAPSASNVVGAIASSAAAGCGGSSSIFIGGAHGCGVGTAAVVVPQSSQQQQQYSGIYFPATTGVGTLQNVVVDHPAFLPSLSPDGSGTGGDCSALGTTPITSVSALINRFNYALYLRSSDDPTLAVSSVAGTAAFGPSGVECGNPQPPPRGPTSTVIHNQRSFNHQQQQQRQPKQCSPTGGDASLTLSPRPPPRSSGPTSSPAATVSSW